MAEITRDALKKIRADMDQALEYVARKNGLTSLKVGNIKFTSGSFTAKVEGVAQGGLDKAAERYQAFRVTDGLPPLNSRFHERGHEWRITGLSPTGAKVHVTRDDGKAFLMRAEYIRRVHATSPDAFIKPTE